MTGALWSTTVGSPVGELTVVASDAGVRAVLWPLDRGVDRVVVGDGVRCAPTHPVLSEAAAQLEEYFAGERRAFDLALDVRGTPFQRAAWEVLATIPYGRTITYGEQASALGDVRKARAVGAANGRNPVSIVVPCHRVIGSSGALTGFGGGMSAKAWLLDHERGVARLV